MLICLDAGHGFENRSQDVYDPGAVAAGIAEADVVLAWALTLKHELVQAGIPVLMTRKSSEDPVPIGRRARFATLGKATHFLSLHCNAAANPFVRGTETFRRDPSVWASKVHLAALAAMQSKDRGLKLENQSQHSRLAVLDAPNPCLLEIGFITNPLDRKLMLSRDVRLTFAHELIKRLKDHP